MQGRGSVYICLGNCIQSPQEHIRTESTLLIKLPVLMCCYSPVVYTEAVRPVFLPNHENRARPRWVRWLDDSILYIFFSFLASSWRTVKVVCLGGCFLGLASAVSIFILTRSISTHSPSSKVNASWWCVGNSLSNSVSGGGNSGSSMVWRSFFFFLSSRVLLQGWSSLS